MEDEVSSARLCLVIPCYNEAGRLDVPSVSGFLERHTNVQLYFVDDGSTDSTFSVLNGLKDNYPDQVSVLQLKSNSGKAEAVRTGMLKAAESEYDFTGYFDADLSTPLEEAFYLADGFKGHPERQLCFGSRVSRAGSTINRKPYRHYLGRVIATAISTLTGLIIYDTQCGAKLFRHQAVHTLFKDPFISKWLFDVEIFLRIRNIYRDEKLMKVVLELPLNRWVHQEGSKISFMYAMSIIPELVRIRRRYVSRVEG